MVTVTFLLVSVSLAGAKGPPVVLVTVDALRADRVSKDLTPNMVRLAREGGLFACALAPVGRTTQGVGTILTGLHPLSHGADGLGMKLGDNVTTLAEVFRAAGYRTGAFASNMFLKPGLGFEQGFDVFSNPAARWHGDSAETLTDEALGWLQRDANGAPPFLWIHYLDPHWTYEPPPEFAKRADPSWTGTLALGEDKDGNQLMKGALVFGADTVLSARQLEHVRRMYDGEVAATDRALGRLVAALAADPRLAGAIVVLTADHGESLGEHRYFFAHGEYAYDTVLEVPWIVRAPGRVPAGTRIDGAVSTEDVAPTLLELAGLPKLANVDGLSFAPALRRGGRSVAPRRQLVEFADHVLVHAENPRRPVAGRPGRWWAIRDGDLKLIRIPLGGGRFDEELYDLAADPGETKNLAGARDADVRRLREALLERQRVLLARWQKTGAENPEAMELETLKSLGYVH